MRNSAPRAVVTGAGGFIGHHLVTFLKAKGFWVRGVDLKYPEFKSTDADEFWRMDLRDPANCQLALSGADDVYALAADMGGMGYISCNHAQILRNNSLINIGSLEAARASGVKRYLFTSSACVYPQYRQLVTHAPALKEEDAYPADPQDAYGWEKLITEQLCTHYRRDYGLQTYIVRFHNIFGPHGTWTGGREKAPAALCRKIALAKLTDTDQIEIWGDGEQTRSFCYIDDCIQGIYRLMNSDFNGPLNLGQDRLISINELAGMIAEIAGVRLKQIHVPGPQGVRGRNSDNTLLHSVLSWTPEISLGEGLIRTYRWIEDQVKASLVSEQILAKQQPCLAEHGGLS